MLQFIGSQRVGHDLVAEQQLQALFPTYTPTKIYLCLYLSFLLAPQPPRFRCSSSSSRLLSSSSFLNPPFPTSQKLSSITSYVQPFSRTVLSAAGLPQNKQVRERVPNRSHWFFFSKYHCLQCFRYIVRTHARVCARVCVCVRVCAGFPGGSVIKNPPAMQETQEKLHSVPESGRSPGGGNGNPLQYSCLENPMDRGAWWAKVFGLQRVRHD